MWTVLDIEDLLQPLEDVIYQFFVPAWFGCSLCLPIKIHVLSQYPWVPLV